MNPIQTLFVGRVRGGVRGGVEWPDLFLAFLFVQPLHQFVHKALGGAVESSVQVAPFLGVAPEVIAGLGIYDGYVTCSPLSQALSCSWY